MRTREARGVRAAADGCNCPDLVGERSGNPVTRPICKSIQWSVPSLASYCRSSGEEIL